MIELVTKRKATLAAEVHPLIFGFSFEYWELCNL
jgi:hypothetical protein